MRDKLLTFVALGALGLTMFSPGAEAGTEDETYLFGLINQERCRVTAQDEGRSDVEQRRRRRRRSRQPKPPPSSCTATLVEHAAILGEVRAHSQDMAQRASLDHNGFDERVARIRAADGGIARHICENAAFVGGLSGRAALDQVFQGWLASPPHKRCMLDVDAKSDSAAVGLFQSGDTLWATFITAEDATP